MIPDKRLIRFVSQELLAGNPSFKLIVNRHDWLCPYCGEIGASKLRMEESLELRITQHLGRCPLFKSIDQEPLDRGTLERRAQMLTLKRKLRKSLRRDPVWQIVDPKGLWVCPYCAKLTEERVHVPYQDMPREKRQQRLEKDLVRVLKHLMRCDHFQEDKEPRSLEDLLDARDKGLRVRRAEQVREQLTANPLWRLRDMNKTWLCPFCAQTTGLTFHRDREPSIDLCDQVARHLDSCGAHMRLNGRPRTERYLKDRVIAINRERILGRLERKLTTHPIWQVTDADDEWYCPYCAKATGVRLHEPGQGVTSATLNEVWTHLGACSNYSGKRADELQTRRAILQAVARADRRKRLRREVRTSLLSDPRFAVHDAFGSWLCPYCLKIQKRIAVSTAGSLLDKTVEQVASHLREHCTGYAEGETPASTLPALEAQVGRKPKEPATDSARLRAPAPAESQSSETPSLPGLPTARGSRPAPSDSEWVRRIDMEMATLKQKVEVTRELERSLEDARGRQMRLMPRLPEMEGYEFGIVYQPCSRVGGDFYDFFRVSERELGIVVGDVAGHGIEAALLVGL
ncbi:MAG: PP2C family protein-serine/threonine phosphatase, partial [Planctomycetota bacterium]